MNAISKMKQNKAPVAVLPTAIDLAVHKIPVKEGELNQYWVRGQIGPLHISGVKVVENEFKTDSGETRVGLNVETPSTESDKVNPESNRPYRNYKYRPTQDARKDFNMVVTDAVKLFEDANYTPYQREFMTEWPHMHSLQEVAKRTIHINKDVFQEDLDEDSLTYFAVATLAYAGFEINGVFLKIKKQKVAQRDEDGKPVRDADDNLVMVEREPREYDATDGEFTDFYVQFPQQEQLKDGRRFSYISPTSKAVSVDFRDDYYKLAERRLAQLSA